MFLRSYVDKLFNLIRPSIINMIIELLGLLANQLPSQTEATATIATSTEPVTTVRPTIDLSEVCGGPGWRRVAFINMTDPNQDCPEGLSLISFPIRSGRTHADEFNCSSSVTFSVNDSA